MNGLLPERTLEAPAITLGNSICLMPSHRANLTLLCHELRDVAPIRAVGMLSLDCRYLYEAATRSAGSHQRPIQHCSYVAAAEGRPMAYAVIMFALSDCLMVYRGYRYLDGPVVARDGACCNSEASCMLGGS